MSTDVGESWSYLVDPSDSSIRMLMALLRLLLDKGLITDEELWSLADHSCQELETEENARRVWHTPWLPTKELAAKVSISSETVILDAGSGFGGPARQLAEQFGCRVIGVDRDPLRVLHAIRQTQKMGLSHRVSFCWGVFQNLPFPDGIFDVVWAQGSVTRYDLPWVEGVPTGMDPSIFREFHRALKNEGQLVCDVWIKGPVKDADVEQFLHLTSFTLDDLEDCTTTWLKCQQWAISELRVDDPRRESWRQTYEEAVQRQDRSYQFVATKRSDNES